MFIMLYTTENKKCKNKYVVISPALSGLAFYLAFLPISEQVCMLSKSQVTSGIN